MVISVISVSKVVKVVRVIRVIRLTKVTRRSCAAVACSLLACYFAHSVTAIPCPQIFARAAKPVSVTGSQLLCRSRPARTT
jgi:hypothetical protein